MLSARVAGEQDGAELSRLWRESVAGLAGLRGGTTLAASLSERYPFRDIPSILLRPGRIVVLGCVDGVPVGLSYAELRRTGAERVLSLEVVFVELEARRVGLADAMLGVLLEETSGWDVTAIDAPALPGDRATKSFFESHGFRARLLVMRRSFDRPARS